jgi:hypothetical protein
MPDRDGVNRNEGSSKGDDMMALSVARSELIRQQE